jgi:hypothetical protein
MKVSLEKTKAHLYENRTTYLVSGALVLGVGIGFALRSPKVTQSVQTWVIGCYKSPVTVNVTQIIIPALGDPGDVIRCVEDGMTYASRGQLSRATGKSMGTIAKHLLDPTQALDGYHYEVVAKAGLPFFA